MLFLLLIVLLSPCRTETTVLLRIGVLYDHYAQAYYPVAQSTIELFTKVTATDDRVKVEQIKYDLEQAPNTYDILLQSDLTVIIVVAKKLKCDRLQSVKKRIPIFVVTGTVENCDDQDITNSILYLYPSDSAILNTMLMAAAKYEWKSAIVLGEKNEEFDFTFTNMQQARERGVETTALEVNTVKSVLRETLLTAKREGIRSFILMSQMDHVDIMLSMAEEVELTDKNFHWFIPNVFVKPESLLEFVQKGMQISILYSPILTPLIHKIVEKENGNASASFMMNEVVSSLTFLSMNLTLSSCDKRKSGQCFNNSNIDTVCKPNPEDIIASLKPTTSAYIATEQPTTQTTTTAPTTVVNILNESTTAGVARSFMKRSVIQINYVSPAGEQTDCGSCVERNFISSVCSKKHCLHSKNTKIPVLVSSGSQDEGTIHTRKKRATTVYSNKNVNSVANILTPNSGCLMMEWTDEIVSAASAITKLFVNRPPGYGKDNITSQSVKKASNIPIPTTILDSCLFTSKYFWEYDNKTCSYDLMKNAEEKLANTQFVVEYVAKRSSVAKSAGQPLVVGAYNTGNNSYISSTYKPLHLYDVYLPKRDFVIAAIKHPPWLSWTEDEKTGELIFKGYLYEILKQLSQSMGFTYQLVIDYDFTGDLMYVEEVEKHMFKLFANNTVDFFLHAKSVRGKRLGKSDLVYLTAPFQKPYMFLLTKRVESTESVSIWQFMLPFREESWIVFWGSFILVSFLMTYYNKKNPNEYKAIAHTFGPNSSPSDHLGLLNSLWFNFAPICGQGASLVPQSTACTVLTGTWWLFLLLVVSAYTANMTAFMTQANNGGIKTLTELANQQEFAYGIMETSAMYQLFLPQSKIAPYTKHVFKKQEDAFERVLEGNFFMVADFESAVEAMATSCDFDIKGKGFYQYQFALPFPRGSVYIPMFNDHIRKLRDNGVLAELEKKWFTIEKDCEVEKTENSVENQLDMKAFIGMYVFLTIGVTGGLIVCLFETGWIKYGGISGVFGRAGIYELDTDRKEIQRANDLLEKEFESWEGGWQVWKHKEWKQGDDTIYETDSPRPASRKMKCDVCGRGFSNQSNEVRKKPEIALTITAPIIRKEEEIIESLNNRKLKTASDGVQLKSIKTETASKKVDPPLELNAKNNSSEIAEQAKKKSLEAKKPSIYPMLPVKTSPDYNEKEKGSIAIGEEGNTKKKTEKKAEKIVMEERRAHETSTANFETKLQKPSTYRSALKPTKYEKELPCITVIAPKSATDPVSPKITTEPQRIPLESFSPVAEERMDSSLSMESTFSHSSLASGTLSFMSESDESVSTIHPLTPFELSPTPLSGYTESALSRDYQSSFRSETSYYSTSSYEGESGYSRQSSWSRSMRETPISYLSDLTEDAHSDVTVISRRQRRD